jgi:hypothetical protein
MQKIHVYSLKDISKLSSVIEFAHRHNIVVDEHSWQSNCRDFYLRVPDHCKALVEHELDSALERIDVTWEISL